MCRTGLSWPAGLFQPEGSWKTDKQATLGGNGPLLSAPWQPREPGNKTAFRTSSLLDILDICVVRSGGMISGMEVVYSHRRRPEDLINEAGAFGWFSDGGKLVTAGNGPYLESVYLTTVWLSPWRAAVNNLNDPYIMSGDWYSITFKQFLFNPLLCSYSVFYLVSIPDLSWSGSRWIHESRQLRVFAGNTFTFTFISLAGAVIAPKWGNTSKQTTWMGSRSITGPHAGTLPHLGAIYFQQFTYWNDFGRSEETGDHGGNSRRAQDRPEDPVN